MNTQPTKPKRRGRPQGDGRKENGSVISAVVTAAERSAFEAVAKARGRTLSECARRAVTALLELDAQNRIDWAAPLDAPILPVGRISEGGNNAR